MGEITFETAQSPERADALIVAALALKRDWAVRHGFRAPALFDPRFEACFHDAARSGDPHASLRVFAMLQSGRPIGVEVSLAYRGRLFAHVLAHDCSLAKFGVGSVLADASIEQARMQGYEVFDLLAPADAYKREWSHGEVEVNDLLLAGAWQGAVLGALTTELARVARAGVRRAPPSLMRAFVRMAERRRLDTPMEPR
jgi:CelD/BcsL family acetyltransferase involved in cellulose biosynthesis